MKKKMLLSVESFEDCCVVLDEVREYLNERFVMEPTLSRKGVLKFLRTTAEEFVDLLKNIKDPTPKTLEAPPDKLNFPTAAMIKPDPVEIEKVRNDEVEHPMVVEDKERKD